MLALTAVLAAGLAAVHIAAGKLRFLDVVPRSRWLSFSGGVAVAYVFLHILPELSSHRETFGASLGGSAEAAEAWVYSVALVGLAAFYGLERAARQSRVQAARRENCRSRDHLAPHRFVRDLQRPHWVSAAPSRRERPVAAPHVFPGRIGRWLMASAVLFGWVTIQRSTGSHIGDRSQREDLDRGRTSSNHSWMPGLDPLQIDLERGFG
jgi:zinc transporter ZupT